jgi:4-amino-4-deoxy-L-arabinose transferase-like glycosyltransferase
VVATSSNFSTGHIALTGLISGVLAALFAVFWLRGENRTLDTIAIGLLTAGAVFLLRKSANMPELNNDGLQGFSANDWLAPIVAFVALGLYGAARPPAEPRRFEQARAAATVLAFAVNVVTI